LKKPPGGDVSKKRKTGSKGGETEKRGPAKEKALFWCYHSGVKTPGRREGKKWGKTGGGKGQHIGGGGGKNISH